QPARAGTLPKSPIAFRPAARRDVARSGRWRVQARKVRKKFGAFSPGGEGRGGECSSNFLSPCERTGLRVTRQQPRRVRLQFAENGPEFTREPFISRATPASRSRLAGAQSPESSAREILPCE